MEPWHGTGSLYFSARWHDHRFQRRVIYAATSPALACVEVLVRLERDVAPTNYLLGEAEIDDGFIEDPYRKLTAKQVEALRFRVEQTQAEGMEWLRSKRSAALFVPSFAVQYDWNVLLNLEHPAFSRLRPLPARPFSFDLRLFRAPEKPEL